MSKSPQSKSDRAWHRKIRGEVFRNSRLTFSPSQRTKGPLTEKQFHCQWTVSPRSAHALRGRNPSEAMHPHPLLRLEVVRVCWGCWVDCVASTTGLDFLIVLEARSLRSRCQQGGFLLRPPSSACQCPSSLCVLTEPFLCVWILISSYY